MSQVLQAKPINKWYRGRHVVISVHCDILQMPIILFSLQQDGHVEDHILSRDLFPIHALDEQEFFPGDFVVRSAESVGADFDPHLYGVIQGPIIIKLFLLSLMLP